MKHLRRTASDVLHALDSPLLLCVHATARQCGMLANPLLQASLVIARYCLWLINAKFVVSPFRMYVTVMHIDFCLTCAACSAFRTEASD